MENNTNNNNSSSSFLWTCSCGNEAMSTINVLGKTFDVCETCYEEEMDSQFDPSQNWDSYQDLDY